MPELLAQRTSSFEYTPDDDCSLLKTHTHLNPATPTKAPSIYLVDQLENQM